MSSHASASSDRGRDNAHGLDLDIAGADKDHNASSGSNKDSPQMAGNGRPSYLSQKQPIVAETRKKSVYEAETDKCPVCTKSVFSVERVICAGLNWHKSCFVCGGTGDRGCKKKLTLDYKVHLSNPYCRMCYHKAALAPGGAASRSESIMGVSEGVDEVPKPVVASSYGTARQEMPQLLAGVRVSERASQFGSTRGSMTSNKCLNCNKTVFLAEETRAAGALWHKMCFTCGAASESKSGCQRVLAKDNFTQLQGVPMCKACYPIFSKDPNFRGLRIDRNYPQNWKNQPSSTMKTLFNGEVKEEEEEEEEDRGRGAAEEFPEDEDLALNPDEQIQIQLERELELMELNKKEGLDTARKNQEIDDDDKEDDVITKVQGGVAEWEFEGDKDDERSARDDPRALSFGVSSNKNGRQVLTKILSGFTAPFDKNGVLFHIGTAGGTEPYQNPHLTGAVTASMSSIYKGYVHHVVEQKRSLMPNYSNNTKRSWVAVDLGKGRRLMPTRYCIRHGASGRGNALRNWELRARERDTDSWTVLRAHYNDDAISELPYSAAAWKLRPPKVVDDKDGVERAWPDSDGFRYFLILQMGLNSSNNDCFFIGGMELYGTLTEEEGLDE